MLINKSDNVEVNLCDGHKYAVCDIKKSEKVIKYGHPIGHALTDIKKGEKVHVHNLATDLSDNMTYEYRYKNYGITPAGSDREFYGYIRENGDVGIRNDIWIVNTVGCVNKIAERLARKTGAKCFPHPFGCSQLGDDHTVTRQILRGMVNHPNAAGVLVLGLGCENNNIASFKDFLGKYNENRVKFLNCQDAEDEISEGVRIIKELQTYAGTFKRQKVNISRLRIGLKCGGSDGLSGITANSLTGLTADMLIASGGSCILTEVPEMFGAEHLLMERCISKEIFEKCVDMINGYKDYFRRHGQPVYENPSPGNKDGGITTLEEKSLGCVQKGGKSDVVDILDYGDIIRKNGLSLLNGPGNDIVAVTNLMAAGAHIILFTTGRGTPLGSAVPTIKISSNERLWKAKKNWIDFDASPFIDESKHEALANSLFDLIIETAEGKQTKNELNGYSEISIFKDGVTL